ncbi:anti-sigma factor [Microbacterium thalli]|uniref:Anti-sigma factor n=1 Tax=Microbacterium thalli TaxID=3027921 RepID=A0ABT5SGC0_9MICO|nr:anti-sigma factor [Microbacterium thalli]MDD7961858.1 anti-sigma factor [Microbacterium thalli]MDN8549095.1 anti-sigma factor [Microbacterium thalli]
MNEQEFAELSAGYALGALSPEDETAYREALHAHPEYASLADDDARAASFLAEGVEEVAPPADIRASLLARIGAPGTAAPAGNTAVDPDAADPGDELSDDDPRAEATAHPVGSPVTEQIQTVQRRNWTRSLFALTASIALLVGIGWGVGTLTEDMRAPSAESVLAQIERSGDAHSNTAQLADGGEATVHWSPNVEGVVLVADGLPEIADDQSYEAWFVRGSAPIPAGAFESSDGSAALLLEGEMQPDDVIALTIEQSGGSPSGLPTTDPIVAIPTSA